MSKTWYKVEWATCWCFWNWRNYESSTFLYRTWKDNKTSFHNFIIYNNRIAGALHTLPSFIMATRIGRSSARSWIASLSTSCHHFPLIHFLTFTILSSPLVVGWTGGQGDGWTDRTDIFKMFSVYRRKKGYTYRILFLYYIR